MGTEFLKRVDVTDVAVQVVVGTFLGVVFLVAGWFAQGDLRSLLFVLSVFACGAAMVIAFRTQSTRAAAVGGAVAMASLISAIYVVMTRESDDPVPVAVVFEQPAEGAEVSLAGTTASGTLSGELANGHTLWLFISSADAEGIHYMTDRVSVAESGWSLPTGRVGADDPEEVGRTFVLEAVVADSNATEDFEAAIAEDNWASWAELPEGATVVATRRVVRASGAVDVRITAIEPRDGQPGVSSAAGFRATGIARGLLPGESLWLMDKDGVGYTIAQEATIDGYEWSAESYPLGDEGEDLPFGVGAAVVKANQECVSALSAEIDADDSWLPGLPNGCLEMDAKSIEVTRP